MRLGARSAEHLYMEILKMETFKKIDLVLGVILKFASLIYILAKICVLVSTVINYVRVIYYEKLQRALSDKAKSMGVCSYT